MRKISKETDWTQIVIIFILIFVYFYGANKFRPMNYEFSFIYLLTVFHYLITVFFFYFTTGFFHKNNMLSSFAFSIAYTLIPTLIWFITNSFLYVLLPPPRTTSTLGKTFSLLYIAYSVSLLLWKFILTYLAIRFSSKQNVFRVIYVMILYLVMFIPYAVFLYLMGLFRIPFI